MRTLQNQCLSASLLKKVFSDARSLCFYLYVGAKQLVIMSRKAREEVEVWTELLGTPFHDNSDEDVAEQV